MTFGEIIGKIDGFVWGWPLIVALIGTHVFMTIRTGFIQIRKFGLAMMELFADVGEETREETAQALRSGMGFLRRELAQRLNLRQTPELTFIHDDSMEYSIYLGEKLKQIHEEDEERLKAMTPEMREAKEAFEKEAEAQEQQNQEDDLWFLKDEGWNE